MCLNRFLNVKAVVAVFNQGPSPRLRTFVWTSVCSSTQYPASAQWVPALVSPSPANTLAKNVKYSGFWGGGGDGVKHSYNLPINLPSVTSYATFSAARSSTAA